ncbi:MAG TPA: hypothetical protein VFH80_33910 [Solirubrobacteraceae bacterium]|nr:hypothetical protein [Solirubrobacteraceae bacterium]
MRRLWLLAVVGLVVPTGCGSGGKSADKQPVRLRQADRGRTVTLGWDVGR